MQKEYPGKPSIPQPAPDATTHPFGRYSPLRLFVIMLASIFIAEIIAMGVVYVIPSVPYILTTLIDAGIMVILIFPILYSLSFRPLLQKIEELRQAERSLQQKEELKERFFDSIDTLIAYMDRDFNMIRVNNAFAREGGQSLEYFVGQNYFVLYPNEENLRIFRQVVETGEPYAVNEKPFEFPDQPERGVTYWNWSLQPVIGPEGAVDGVVLSQVDVTERKRAEAKVELERARLRAILDTMPYGVYIINQYYDVEYINPVIEREFGLIDGRKCYSYFHDEDVACHWCKNPIVFGGQSTRWEWTSSKTGKTYDVFDTPLNNSDGSLSKLKVMQDITERKRSEERVRLLSSVVEQTADTVVVTNCDGRIEYVNPAFEKLTGYSKEEAIGQTPRVLKSGIHDRQFYRHLWETVLAGQIFHGEIANRKKNGEIFHEVKTITPLRDERGAITRFVATGKDITERKQAEENLRRAFDDLEIRVRDRTEELQIANSELEDEINVRRRVEEALRFSEMELKNAQEVARIGNWKWNLENGEITWSDEMYRIFGIDKNSYTGRLGDVIARVIHPDDLHLVLPSNAQPLAEKKPIEYRILLPDKSIRNIWAKSGEAILNDSGKPVFLTGIAQDITERKRAEEALRQNEATLRGILNATKESIWLFGADGTILMANETALARMARPAEEIIGGHFSKLMSRELADQRQKHLREVIETSHLVEFEDERAGIIFHHNFYPIHSADGTVNQIVAFSRDITERKKIERALRDSEQRLNRAQEIAHLGSWELDLLTNKLTWSDEVYRIFGLPPQEFGASYEAFLEAVHPDDRRAVDQAYVGSIRDGRDMYEIEHRVVRRLNGDIRIVHEKCEHFRNEAGEIIRSVGMVHDITERKQAEEQLARINQKLNEILVSIQDDFYVLDRNWNFAYASRLFTMKIGKEPEDLVGRNIWTLFPKHVGTVLEENFRAAMEKREVRRFELGGKYTSAWYRMTAFPSAEGITVLGTDITDRKKAEEQLRYQAALLSNVNDAIVASDAQYRITAWNSAAEALYGWKADEVIGRNGVEIVRTQWAGKDPEEMRRVIAETGKWRGEATQTRKDGTRFFVEVSSIVLHDSSGDVAGYISVNRDITARKQAEADLRASEEKYRNLFENMTEEVHFWHIERDESGCIKTWRLVDANPPTLRTWGRTSIDEIRGKTTDEIFGPGATEHYLPVVQKIITENDSYSYEDYFPNLDKYFRFTSVPFGEYFITTGADITSIKKAEQALQQSEAMLRTMLDQMPSGVTVRDAATGEIILANARSREIMGDLVPTTNQFAEYHGLHADGRPYRSEEWPVSRSIATGEKVEGEEIELLESNGVRRVISTSSAPVRDSQGKIISGIAVFHDITERKRTEERLRQLNRTLRALSNTNQVMIRATSERQLLDDVCKIVVEDCGHSMVWIGYAQDDEKKSVKPIASAGFEAGYLETLNISWADTERGRGPTGTAIRTGKPSRCNNMLTDPQFAPWREQAIQRGYASSLVLPLITDGRAFGAISIYSREPGSFPKDEEALLLELAGDLAYGIQAIRLRDAHALAEAQLRTARDELEIRVHERTEELATANRELSEEIAERKEIERQLRIQTAAMDSAANGIIITDPNGVILWANPAITQISGYEENDLIGQSTKIFNSGKQAADFYSQMWATILAGKVWHGETTNRRKDGGLYIEEQTITPVQNEDGEISHFIAIKQDVTERHLIYSQLEDSNRDLRKLTASERQQRFLAEGLVEASAALNMSLELHAVLDRIFEQTRRTIPYLIADVALIQDGVANVVQRWGGNRPGLGTIPENENLRLEDFPIWEQILETKSAVMISDTRLDDRWNSNFDTEWIHSYIGAPLIYGGQVIGIINLGSDEANAFHPDMVKTLAAFAAPAAVAIQNARLYEDEQQNRKVAEVLSAASVALSQTLDIEMVMETILDYMQFIMPLDVAFVLLSEGDERYRVRAVRAEGEDRGHYHALRDRMIDILSEPIVSPYFVKHDSTFIPDARQITEWSPPLELASMNCWLGIPLESMGKALGMVVIANAAPRSFTGYQVGLAEAVVKQAVVALQNAWLFEQVRSGRERLQQLSRHLVEVQENERKYIARELHDETSQSLTSLKMGLQVIEQNAAGRAKVLEQVKNLKHLADETLESLHHLAVNLRPASLDHLGLVEALTGLIESTRQRSGLNAHFKTMGSAPAAALTEEIEASVYRIVQESLTNVIRHAHASYADVILEWQDDKLVIIIEDDGVGLDLQKARETGHLGLVGMQERAEMLGGKLVVDSTPQSGTTLVVEIPYANTNTYSR